MSQQNPEDDPKPARVQIDKDVFLDIMRRAAARERTVVEFQTRIEEGERVFDTVLDITEHVEALEERQDKNKPIS